MGGHWTRPESLPSSEESFKAAQDSLFPAQQVNSDSLLSNEFRSISSPLGEDFSSPNTLQEDQSAPDAGSNLETQDSSVVFVAIDFEYKHNSSN